MRRSLETNTLVIVSNHARSIYNDRWIGNTLHYTGMGQTGDQSLDFSQNRTLTESATNGVEVFLYEVFEGGRYEFRGQVKLADKPYQEDQPEGDGNLRKVWMFPLVLVDRTFSTFYKGFYLIFFIV